MKKRKQHTRRKTTIINESSHLFRIFDWILLPLFDAQETRTWKDWLEHAFDIKNRTIRVYEVVEPFFIMGPKVVCDDTYTRLGNTVRTRPGSLVFIRENKRFPNSLDLEARVGKAGDYQVFKITRNEHRRILTYLREIET